MMMIMMMMTITLYQVINTYRLLQVLVSQRVYLSGVVAARTLLRRYADERCWPAAFEPSWLRSSWRFAHRCQAHYSPSFILLFSYLLMSHAPSDKDSQDRQNSSDNRRNSVVWFRRPRSAASFEVSDRQSYIFSIMKNTEKYYAVHAAKRQISATRRNNTHHTKTII